MSDNESFKAGQEQGMMLAEMKEMRKSIDGLTDTLAAFKESSWKRLEEHGVRIAVMEKEFENMATKIETLESAKTWIVRTVGGLIVAGLIGLLYKVR